MDLMPLVANFEITLTNLLDMYAPINKRTINLRRYAPWYNDSIDVEKKKGEYFSDSLISRPG